jgi:transcriptional regulator GlxA family with amidase domain
MLQEKEEPPMTRVVLALALAATLQAGNAIALTPPAKGRITVAVAITEHANVIDFAGPMSVFQSVMVESRGRTEEEQIAFDVYTVSEARSPVTIAGGEFQLVPRYTFDDAPIPKVLVVGAQEGGPKLRAWLKKVYDDPANEVVMSVCTGAFKLAGAGLLDGKPATTHHQFYDSLAKTFPRVKVQKGLRFVQSDSKIFTAGGLTSGMDLAFHIVKLYFGDAVAVKTAAYMEYQGAGWRNPSSAGNP